MTGEIIKESEMRKSSFLDFLVRAGVGKHQKEAYVLYKKHEEKMSPLYKKYTTITGMLDSPFTWVSGIGYIGLLCYAFAGLGGEHADLLRKIGIATAVPGAYIGTIALECLDNPLAKIIKRKLEEKIEKDLTNIFCR